jgi:hypothetical protein
MDSNGADRDWQCDVRKIGGELVSVIASGSESDRSSQVLDLGCLLRMGVRARPVAGIWRESGTSDHRAVNRREEQAFHKVHIIHLLPNPLRRTPFSISFFFVGVAIAGYCGGGIVGDSEGPAAGLSSMQRASILELGSRGAGGEFDTHIMSELMTMGYIEVEPKTRTVILTPTGRAIYGNLIKRLPG